LPADLHIFDQSVETIIFNEKETRIDGKTKFVSLESFDYYLAETLAYQLFLFDIQSVIIEGGAKTLQLFIDAGLWDEARVFIADHTWGDGLPAPAMRFKPAGRERLGHDELLTYSHP
jgi:diaminohydroxyphosphoribosylaminopyrimidine deaminase/5-amino-6-(5-phosphoribosylamino)uracil reductase